MCKAMMEYKQGNYDQTVQLLYPLRYRMVDIGGSDAQVSFTKLDKYTKIKINLEPETRKNRQCKKWRENLTDFHVFADSTIPRFF